MTSGGPLSGPELAALRAELLAYALDLPGATLHHPWGEDAAKVAGKVFAFLSNGDPSHGYVMTVKLRTSGPAALLHRCVEPSGYGLARSGWVSLRHDRGELPPVDVLAGLGRGELPDYCAQAAGRGAGRAARRAGGESNSDAPRGGGG
jgi:predicted DNA-binding protein (MmcQ/YjbR family)